MDKQVLPKEIVEQMTAEFGQDQFGDVMVVGGGVSGIQASLD